MGTFVIADKEIEIKEETADKIDKALDFASEKLPYIVGGACMLILWGYCAGHADGYKRGFKVGQVAGAAQAYTYVMEGLKALRP